MKTISQINLTVQQNHFTVMALGVVVDGSADYAVERQGAYPLSKLPAFALELADRGYTLMNADGNGWYWYQRVTDDEALPPVSNHD